MPSFCTFNVNNLFVRYRFEEKFPGDMSGRSAVTDPRAGYLPMYNPASFELFNSEQRELAAVAVSNNRTLWPDVVCVQEVESLIALRQWNLRHMGGRYTYSVVVDSRDLRQIDVGVLSVLPIEDIRLHLDELDPLDLDRSGSPRPLFSRDCLEVTVRLPRRRRLTLLVNHLKSQFIPPELDTPQARAAARQAADDKRQRQATRIKEIVEQRFSGSRFGTELFAIVGDFNDVPTASTMAPIASLGLVDAMTELPGDADRWTHWWRGENSVSHLDHVWLSPALAKLADPPIIERRGLGFSRVLRDGGIGPRVTRCMRDEDDPNPIDVPFNFARFDGVSTQNYASDHCPITISF